MKQLKLLSLAISAAITASPSLLYAQDNEENEADDSEKIVITGSRIKRAEIEGASPVVVLDEEYLESTGFATVGDILRNSNFNAFGSWGGGSNNGWGSQSTVALKGGSVFHTLVLLDGQRMAKSPVMDGGASNLNTIPMAAVERIEILNDGASAIYGTDAIAGVINIVLKKDFDGIQFYTKKTRPSAEGADSDHLTFTGGLSGEKGNLVLTWEHFENDAIYDRDRWYTAKGLIEGSDPRFLNSWVGMSPTGRTLVRSASTWDYLSPLADGTCDAYNVNGKEEFFGPFEDQQYPADRICGYDYTLEAATTTESRRDNLLAHYTYEISDNLEFRARAYWSKNETLDISAPTPAAIWFDKDLPAYTTPEGIALVHVDNGDHLKYRFNTLGNRTAEHSDDIMDLMFTLSGSTETYDYDISYNYNRYNSFTWGTNYIHTPSLTDAVGDYDAATNTFSGWDPRDPNSAVPDSVKANFDKRSEAVYEEITGGIQFDAAELDAGAIAVYLGASHREIEYRSLIDAQANAGNVLGGNGGEGGIADRTVSAVFFELLAPITEDIELSAAGRYDDYSDFGSTFNPQVALKAHLGESTLLRASWGTGFRAPTLPDLYQGLQTGYGWVKNYVACYQDTGVVGGCGDYWERDVPTSTGGNRDLEPEESETMNLGFVVDISDNWNLTFDIWSMDLEKLIGSESGTNVLLRQAQLWSTGSSEYIGDVIPGLGYDIGSTGRLQQVYALTGNFGASERKGYDIETQYRWETDYGNISATLNWSHYLEYRYTYLDTVTGEELLSENVAGDMYYPDDRINISVGWENGDHAVNLFVAHIDKQEDKGDDGEGNIVVFDKFDAFTQVNLSYTLHLPWQGKVAVGARNLFDEDIPLDVTNGTSGSLYDRRGRTYWVSYEQSF